MNIVAYATLLLNSCMVQKYAIFNLQGSLIQEGLLDENIAIPIGCTIFHIKDFNKNFLLKNY